MSSWDKFTETKLPPKEAFYSNLNMSNISDEDYEHAQKVWVTFNIKNLREYHDLYLKTDIILLSNVFEAFRVTCLEHYKLDPAHLCYNLFSGVELSMRSFFVISIHHLV